MRSKKTIEVANAVDQRARALGGNSGGAVSRGSGLVMGEVAACRLTRRLREEFFGEGELLVRDEDVAGCDPFY
jgi:hypothetical protein